jgi:hypothetical protein
MDEMDARTLAEVRRVLEAATGEHGSPARGAVEVLFAAIERRRERDAVAWDIVRSLAAEVPDREAGMALHTLAARLVEGGAA